MTDSNNGRDQPFAGRNALVTGGSRGIGRATALALARRGARVAIHYGHRERHARAAYTAFEDEGLPAPRLIKADLSSPAAHEAIANQLPQGETLDVLVANAASTVLKSPLELSSEEWDYTLNVSARSLMLLVQAVRPRLARGSSIVAVSSEGARQVMKGYAALASAKAALEALVRALARELGPAGIRVNTVSSFAVDTLSLRQLPGANELLRLGERQTPMGRITEPEDVARAICLLCLPEAAWITGQLLIADGGLSVSLLNA